MAYNPAKYKFQVGDQVKVKGFSEMKRFIQDRTAGIWNVKDGDTGQILKIHFYKRANKKPMIDVRAHPPNFGIFTFWPDDLEKVDRPTPRTPSGTVRKAQEGPGGET